MEYAPDAIRSLFDQIATGYPSAQFAGIVGDSAHSYGYHRGGNYVSGGDYSMQYPQDYNGDGEAASALDVTCASAGEHYALSQALLNAVGNPAMGAMREFYGSVDGWNVCGWDFTGGYPISSDDSHLWHVHLSVHRQHANDHAAMAAVGDAILGRSSGGGAPPPPQPKGAEMIEIFTYGNGIFAWTGSSLWLAPDIGYINALQTSNLYAGDRGVVDAWFFDAALAMSNTSRGSLPETFSA